MLDGVRVIKTAIKVNKPGEHKLRIYLVDPALVLQKLMIDTGGLKPSYLGPEQSQRIPVVLEAAASLTAPSRPSHIG